MRVNKSQPKLSANRTFRRPSSQEITQAAIRAAIEQKGLDVRGISLCGVSDVADYFVLVSGTSERHVSGIADKIKSALQSINEEPISIIGYEKADWILLDYGDLVVHVFHEPSRQFYNLDELWEDAEDVELPEDLKLHARKLRTGIYT